MTQPSRFREAGWLIWTLDGAEPRPKQLFHFHQFHIENQRRGLVRAILTEGLHRVQRLGAVRAFRGGLEPGPDALYSLVPSPNCDRLEQWVKEW